MTIFYREIDAKARPFPHSTFNFNFSIMNLDNSLDVWKSQPEAFHIMDISGRNTIEPLENLRLMFFRYTNPIIFNLYDHPIVFVLGH